MKKVCCMCKTEKPEGQFNWKKTGIARISYCRDCWKIKCKEHYHANKQQYFDRNNRRRRYMKKLLIAYLLKHPCVDCTESDPACLDFDHNNRNTKKDLVTAMCSRYTWPQIFEEIKKCTVRCANCHRKKTRKEEGWYKRHNDVLSRTYTPPIEVSHLNYLWDIDGQKERNRKAVKKT